MSDYSGNPALRKAIRFALFGNAVAAIGVAQAQTPAAEATAAPIQEVVVTGSRLVIPNDVAISPVVTVSPEVIQQSGVNRVEDLLNSMPQVFASQNSNVSNGSDGTATIDLRGLGPQRTLVLVNGRRLAPGTPTTGGGAADVNQIPAELIERIDILTGGASSVYGADAVAGVVNFVLNDHFEGVKLVANYGLYNHHNNNNQDVGTDLLAWNQTWGTNFTPAPGTTNGGYQRDLAFMVGFNAPDNKGNVTAYATYRRVAAVLQKNYDYSACNLASGSYTTSPSAAPGHFGCAGSSTSDPGRFRLVNQFGSSIGGSKTIDYSSGTPTLVPFGNAARYNFQPTNYFQRPDERYTAGVLAHYEFNEHADVYTEIHYMNDRSVSQIAPGGAFYGTGPYQVNCANPEFSQSMINTWCGGTADPTKNIYLLVGRRSVESGGRRDDLEHTAWRLVIGDKGKINDAWTYDVYGSYAITQLAETYNNDFSISHLKNALNVVTDPATGRPVCNSVLTGTDPTCVPWDIFQQGAVTQQALKYVSVPLVLRGQVDQREVTGNVTGDLGKYGVQLPTAKNGLQANVGVDWRQVINSTTPDLEFLSGDGAGQGGPTPAVDGQITSREAFMEARLPLVEDKPFFHSLAFETGYRYSDYSLGFSTNTYKFGLEWSPVQEVRLRGSFARAVRAPNSAELFEPRKVVLDGVTDPCSGYLTKRPHPAFSLAQCELMGVTPALYGTIDPNSAAQYNGQEGGNPNLKPETAITKSFGIGWTPAYIPGFRAQVDYFDINIKDEITRVGGDTILGLCGNYGLLCNQVHRDINGSLWVSPSGYVDDPRNNQESVHEKGVDIDMGYRLDMGKGGRLNLNYIATYLQDLEITAIQSIPTLTTYNCAGYFGNNCTFDFGPNFRWRHTLRGTWETPLHGLDVSVAWRYISSAKLDLLSPNPILNGGSVGVCSPTVSTNCAPNTDAHLPSVSYVDLTASFQANDHINLRVGVNNVLDKTPPVIGSNNCAGCNGNTYASAYDVLGRYLFGTVTVQF